MIGAHGGTRPFHLSRIDEELDPMRSLALTSGGRRLAAASLFAAGALAGAAAADEVAGAGGDAGGAAGGTVVEKLLDILLQQKSITKGQYEALLEQARQEEAV